MSDKVVRQGARAGGGARNSRRRCSEELQMKAGKLDMLGEFHSDSTLAQLGIGIHLNARRYTQEVHPKPFRNFGESEEG